MVPDQRRAHRQRAPGRLHIEAQAFRRRRVCPWRAPWPQPPARSVSRSVWGAIRNWRPQGSSILTAAQRGGGAPQPSNRSCLAAKYSSMVVVEIQVVSGQVREDRGVEPEAVHPPQRERVGGDLHCDMRAAPLLKFREEPVQVQRFRRGVRRGPDLARHPVLNRPDQRRGLAGRAQDGIHQPGDRGLSVGAGDAGEQQPLVRRADRSCGPPAPAPAGRAPPRSTARRIPRAWRARSPRRGRPASTASCAKLRPSACWPWKGEEEGVLPHSAGIVLQVLDRETGQFRGKAATQPDSGEDLR